MSDQLNTQCCIQRARGHGLQHNGTGLIIPQSQNETGTGLECYIRHGRIMRIYEGSSEIQRNIIARSLPRWFLNAASPAAHRGAWPSAAERRYDRETP